MKIKKYLLILGLHLGILGATVSAPIAMAYIDELKQKAQQLEDKERFGEYIDDFFVSSKNNRPLRLDTSKSIAVYFDNIIDSKTRKNILDGVNGLHNICPNINYTLYNGNLNTNNCQGTIYFSIKKDMGNVAGRTYYSYNNESAEILYPIEIELNQSYIDAYWSSDYTDSVLTTIVKHELMHTLGFEDKTETRSKNESIMFEMLNPEVQTYTEQDIEKINYVYGSKVLAQSTKQTKLHYVPATNLSLACTEKEEDALAN